MTNTILIEVAPGELIDKITILEIKAERIDEPAKLANVRIELEAITATRDKSVPQSIELDELSDELKKINIKLWEIEDDIRNCERNKDFGPEFVRLARSVYVTNDIRASLKRDINKLLGSRLIEEKSYAGY